MSVKNDFDRQHTSQYRNLGLFLSDNHMQQLNLTDSIAPSDVLLNSLKKYSSSCLSTNTGRPRDDSLLPDVQRNILAEKQSPRTP